MNPLIGGTIVTLLYILKQFPWIFNYPLKITKKNARAMYEIAAQLLEYITLIVSILFFLMSLQPILVLFYKNINFIAVGIPILVFTMLALILVALIKMIMLKKKSTNFNSNIKVSGRLLPRKTESFFNQRIVILLFLLEHSEDSLSYLWLRLVYLKFDWNGTQWKEIMAYYHQSSPIKRSTVFIN